jgi:alkylated DNA repair dioxygenase AlkB
MGREIVAGRARRRHISLSHMAPPNPARAAQLRLFGGSGEPTVDASFAAARRLALDERSWVEHVPGWLSNDEALFESLLGLAGWQQRDRWMYDRAVREPRLTAQFPVLAQAPIPLLHTIAAVLSQRYGVVYDGLWINLYRDHHDSTAWHGDRSCLPDECSVPVLSLGETRRFLLRPRGGGRGTSLTVVGGDLVVMGGRCQRDWLHSVPKQTQPAGARISVNFQSSFQAAPPDRDGAPKRR